MKINPFTIQAMPLPLFNCWPRDLTGLRWEEDSDLGQPLHSGGRQAVQNSNRGDSGQVASLKKNQKKNQKKKLPGGPCPIGILTRKHIFNQPAFTFFTSSHSGNDSDSELSFPPL